MTSTFTIALAIAALAIPLYCAYLIVRRIPHRGRHSGRKSAEHIECVGCVDIESGPSPHR